MKKNLINNISIYKRGVSLLISAAMLLELLPVEPIKGLVDRFSLKAEAAYDLGSVAADPYTTLGDAYDPTDYDEFAPNCDRFYDNDGNYAGNSYDLKSFQELAIYSQEYYYRPLEHQNDTISFYFPNVDELTNVPSDFISIGANYADDEDYGFKGNLVFTASEDENKGVLNLDKPLFYYIIDTATITDNAHRFIIRRNASSSTSAFAYKVVASGDKSAETANTWAFSYENYIYEIEGTPYYAKNSFSGMIDTIDSNAHINLSLNLRSDPSEPTLGTLTSSGNVGLICGTMESDSSINVTGYNSYNIEGTTNNRYSTQNVGFTVSTTGSNTGAGVFIGEMKSGSAFSISASNVGGTRTVSGGYSGGVVGIAESATIDLGSNYTVTETISGTTASGGIAGLYKSNGETFDATKVAVNCSLSGGTDRGGLFGVLENTGVTSSGETPTYTSAVFTISGNGISGTSTLRSSGAGNYGGLIGRYYTDNLSNTLELSSIHAQISPTGADTNAGGLISRIDESSSGYSPAYIKITDAKATKSGSHRAGAAVIANGGSAGSFLDCGSFTASGNFNTGIAYNYTNGVIRLSGTTDLDAVVISENGGNYTAYSQFVKSRDNTLIYATGTGASGSGWELKRSNSNITFNGCDDIGSWGEVVRLDGTKLSEALLFYNSSTITSDHYVSLKTAPISGTAVSIADEDDFALMALSVQLGGSDIGALRFQTPNASIKTSFLGSTITLTGNADMSGTGILGFTRDNDSTAIFTGTLTGGSANKTITLGIGEAYGARKNGSTGTLQSYNDTNIYGQTTNAYEGFGKISSHQYNGLFAGTQGAEFSYVTVDGDAFVYANSAADPMYIGGFSAVSYGDDSFSNSGSNIRYDYHYSSSQEINTYFGGFIGKVDSTATDRISATTCSATFNSRVYGSENNIAGGFIGYVAGSSEIEANEFTISGDCAEVSGKSAKTFRISGLISTIDATNVNNIILKNVTVNGLSLTGYGYDKMSGLLGYSWENCNVAIGTDNTNNSGGITIAGTTAGTNSISGGSRYMAGLVNTASGYWKVNHVSVASGFSVDTTAKASFGMLVNRADQLYLEVENEAGLDYASGISIDSDVTVYDEIVAFTTEPNYANSDTFSVAKTLFEQRGSGIISVHIDGSTASSYSLGDGYTPQTDYAETVTSNRFSRYYYNLDIIRNKATFALTNGEKLLLFSTYYVSANDIRQLVTGEVESLGTAFIENNRRGFDVNLAALPFTADAECDMTLLSYYPIDVGAMDTQKLKKVIFANATIETAFDDDLSTRSATQHYLMHCGLFRNVSGNLTVGNDLTLQGTIGCYSAPNYTSSGVTDNGSGALICGTMTNNTSGITISNGSKNLILNALSVANLPTGDNAYAPLLINKIDTNTTMNLSNVSQSGYSGSNDAATSLIGDVGSATAQNIELNFSGIKLDSRKNTTVTDLNDVFGTTKSIFTKATLLNKFQYEANSSGTYNYTVEEDWGENGTGGDRKVTYGYEVSHSVEYLDREKNYLGSPYFTNPTAYTKLDNFDFAESKYLRYVATAYDADNKTHELKVNLSYSNLVEGCGRYNDPYIISSTDSEGKGQLQLDSVANIINGVAPDPELRIALPSNISSSPQAMFSGSIGWCTGSDAIYKYVNGNFVALTSEELTTEGYSNFSAPGNTYTQDLVRQYLAGAYYKITSDINLSQHFVGLGAASTNGEYAFRGVIVGDKKNASGSYTGTAPTITNSSTSPLINISNGSVIKNIELIVAPFTSITRTEDNGGLFTYTSGSCLSYGALIERVMGGDNIIDKVGVSYDSTARIGVGGDKRYLVPVGGYIGVVLDGGVFFRNMGSVSNKGGLTDSSLTVGSVADGSTQFLYINPIIGRVINGFAVTETTSAYNGTATTMNNGTKNYSIADITTDSTGGTLTINNSTPAITAPTAQSWFILSCLIQSGLMESGTSYVGTGTGNAYKTRHCGTYADVGDTTKTVSTVCDSALFVSGYAEQGTVSPWILTSTNYTNGTRPDSSKSYAISMGNSTTPATWTLPKGYRGIGSFASGSNANNITVASITGNNTTITLNMKYQSYHEGNQPDSTNHGIKQDNYNPSDSGFGLFNNLKCSSNATVENITLSGNVYTEVLEKTTGQPFHEYDTINNKSYDRQYAYNLSIDNNVRLSTGMFAGRKMTDTNKCTLTNVDISSINLHSCRSAGGLVGQGKNLYLTSCDASDVTVLGRWDTGGLIGYVSDGCTITNTSGKASIAINAITQQAAGFNGHSRAGYVGGVVGRAHKGSASSDAAGALTISNIKVLKYSSGTGCVEYDNSIAVQKDDDGFVGGIYGGNGVGSSNNVSISNCEVEEISLKGRMSSAGIVVGGMEAGGSLTINTVTVDGKNTAQITDVGTAGKDTNGSGLVIGRSNKAATVISTSVKNYTINRSVTGYIGGCLGFQKGSSLTVKNFYIENCNFNGVCTNGGGIAGYLSGSLSGYNIVEKNLTKTAANYKADLIGNQNGKEVKVVGFSRHNGVGTVQAICSGTKYANSYVVCADFNGQCITASPNTTPSTVNVSGTAMDNYKLSPYALINPVADWVDSKTLTGNGYASTIAGLPISSIISAKNTNSAYADVTDGTNNTVNTYGNFSTFGGTGKLSTFKTEFPNANNSIPTATYSAIPDFPLLILDNTNPAQLTKFLNGYLGLLTNTNYNFATNNNNVYTVNNTAYRYVNGSFTAQSSSNLIRNTTTGQFSMSNSSVDNSPYTQFTLLDIQFKDPTSNSNVAYHLYVPVLVKKLMQFDFEAASNSGTLYEPTYYEALINAQYTGATQPINATSNKLLETLKTPVTVYFKYTYRRTLEEWTRALEGGEDLTKGFDKTLTFNVQKNSAATNVIPAGTKYALVDNTRGHKVYYSTASNPPTSGNLSIALTKTGNSFTDESNTAYTPPSFSKLLGITAEKADNGLFVIAGTNETATAEDVNGTKYRLYGSVSTDSSADPQPDRYNLSIDTTNCLKEESLGVYALEESYYLSIFTPSGNNDVYHYTLNKFDNFGDNSFPTKIYNYVGTELYIGDLFEQDFTIVSNESDNEKITAPNGEINADLRTKITVKSEQAHNVFKTVLSNGDVSMFHSFFVSLVRMDEDGTVKGILVKDDDGMTPTVTYSIAGTPMTEVHEVTDNYVSITASGNTGNLATSLGASTAVTDGVTITGTIKLAYTNNISAQFPPKSDPSDTTKGTYFTATSNLSSTKDNIAYSTSTSYDQDVSTIPNDAVHNNHLYYCQQSNVAELNYYAEEQMDNEGGILGQLGVNAWIPNDESEEQVELSFVSTEAKYTVLPIDSRSTAEYVYLTITLQSRQGDYANNLPINEYWSDYKVLSANGTVITPTSYLDPSGNSVSGNSSNVVKLVYLVPRQNMVDGMGASNVFEESAYEIKIPITFWVKTGDNWANNASHYYSNYQVSIHAELRDATDTSKSAETASEKDASLKYTNAKIHWQYFD